MRKDLIIAFLVLKVLQFCWMGGNCILVECHLFGGLRSPGLPRQFLPSHPHRNPNVKLANLTNHKY